MTTNNLFPMTGTISIATGILGFLAVVSFIFFAILHGPFGTLNDIFNGLMAVSSMLLAWMIYSNQQVKPIFPGGVMLILVTIGTLLAILGSVLVIFRFTGFILAGLYTAMGYGFFGSFLLGLSIGAVQDHSLPRSLAILGIACGAIMIAGLAVLPGMIKSIDTQEQMPRVINTLWQASFFGTYILYPTWCIWLGKFLLRA